MGIVDHDKSNDLWLTVAANDLEEKVIVIPDGESWNIQEIDGSGAGDNTASCLVWDSTILFCTISSLNLQFNTTLVGDGVKELKIVLDNDTNASHPMGLRFSARKL